MGNILVIGDVIIDRYTTGKKLGLSAETPTIVAEKTGEKMYVGGAGLVVRHLLRLGESVRLLTVSGHQDEHLYVLLPESSDPLSSDEMGRFTYHPHDLLGWRFSEKHRMFVEGYKLLQYDSLNKGSWTQETRKHFFKVFCELVSDADALIICDNGHGVMCEYLARDVLLLSEGIQTYVDCQVSQKESRHRWYENTETMLLNEKEAASLSSFTKFRNTVTKLGNRGSIAYVVGEPTPIVTPASGHVAVDTCGAGDAFMAALVSSRLAGDDWERALRKANDWAGLSTTYLGTIVPEVR